MNGERTRLIIPRMTNEAQLATTFRTERRQFVKGWTAAADVVMCAAARATRGLSPAGGAPGAGKSETLSLNGSSISGSACGREVVTGGASVRAPACAGIRR